MQNKTDWATDVTKIFIDTVARMGYGSESSKSFAEGVRAAVILINGIQSFDPENKLLQEVLQGLLCEMKRKKFDQSASVFMARLPL